MGNAAAKLPNPKQTLMNSAIKFAIDESCKATAKRIFKRRNASASETDIRVVSNQVCDMVSLTTDLILKSSNGKEITATDLAPFLIREHVNLTTLTESQQALCGAAIVDLALNGYKMWNEGCSTARDTEGGAAIGEIGGPELAILFGGVAFGSHVPELVSRSSKLVNAALDVYGQCGPLAMNKTPKPRVFPKH